MVKRRRKEVCERDCWDWRQRRIGLAVMGRSSSVGIVASVLCLVMNAALLCNGGMTSSFVRKEEKSVDMPLDSDVFAEPPGYNAPQQVSFFFFFFSFFLSFIWWRRRRQRWRRFCYPLNSLFSYTFLFFFFCSS